MSLLNACWIVYVSELYGHVEHKYENSKRRRLNQNGYYARTGFCVWREYRTRASSAVNKIFKVQTKSQQSLESKQMPTGPIGKM